jgi:isochorismate synthase
MTSSVHPPVAGGSSSPGDDAAALGEALAILLEDGRGPVTGLLSASVPTTGLEPISLVAAAMEADLETALWLRPSEGTAFVGIGRAWAAEGAGADRFREAEAAWRRLLDGARLDRGDSAMGGGTSPDGASAVRGRGPLLLGALGFTGRAPDAADPWGPFGASSLVLPELLLAVTPEGAFLTGSIVGGDGVPVVPAAVRGLERRWERLAVRARALAPNPNGIVAMPVFAPLAVTDEQPTHDHWRRLVGMFAGAVGRGRIDKVVLARRVGLRSPVELDVPNALRRLSTAAPESTTYAFRRDGRTFLGATPERLVRTEGRTFRTVAVAGTIGRGADEAEDATLARALLASEKDREEHAIVVGFIRGLLLPVTETLEVAPEPGIMTLRFVQHLVTEIAGTVKDAHGLLALGERLHPTPAVGGDPRDAALALLDEHEGFDRGWYAGPVGWLGADGDGELCVALRCGIVDRTNAWLFAGCGIVADSDPDAEWEESRIKLRAVVSALGIPGDEQ